MFEKFRVLLATVRARGFFALFHVNVDFTCLDARGFSEDGRAKSSEAITLAVGPSEYVDFNAENEEHRIEMVPLSNNSPVSQTRDQTWQPTPNSPIAGFNGNVTNEGHEAGDGTIMPQQTERATPEPSQSRPTQTMDQNETFKSGVKVAFWATSISASGVTAVWTEFLVNQPNTPKCKFFARAALISMSASFLSGLLIFILSFIRPKFHATTMMVKIFMFVAIGSTALVVGFGVVFYFEKSG